MNSDIPPTNSLEPQAPADRRRSGWAEVRRSYPGLIATLLAALVMLIAMSGWILVKRGRYQAEISRLRESMTDIERRRADEIVAREDHKLLVAVEMLRRQAQLERVLHLAIAVDSSTMYLERDGAMLRAMPIQLGPERRVGIAPDTVRLAAPRGVRTIAAIVTEADVWEVPAWIFEERGVPVPEDRKVQGALGSVALLLEGGTIIYSMPRLGPLGDSAYVLPGAVRARADDLRAVLPNLSRGMRVYFY